MVEYIYKYRWIGCVTCRKIFALNQIFFVSPEPPTMLDLVAHFLIPNLPHSRFRIPIPSTFKSRLTLSLTRISTVCLVLTSNFGRLDDLFKSKSFRHFVDVKVAWFYLFFAMRWFKPDLYNAEKRNLLLRLDFQIDDLNKHWHIALILKIRLFHFIQQHELLCSHPKQSLLFNVRI